MKKKFSLLAFFGAIVVVAAVAAGFSGTARSASTVNALPSSSCGPIVYKGVGQAGLHHRLGSAAPGRDPQQTVQISRAMIWALQQKGWKAGSTRSAISPVTTRPRSPAVGTREVRDERPPLCDQHVGHRRRRDVQLRLRQDRGADPQPRPSGPVLMVSPANTNVGLTKKWDPGEPQKYYPTGVRNYARVVATDDIQGPADAMWSKALRATRRCSS